MNAPPVIWQEEKWGGRIKKPFPYNNMFQSDGQGCYASHSSCRLCQVKVPLAVSSSTFVKLSCLYSHTFTCSLISSSQVRRLKNRNKEQGLLAEKFRSKRSEVCSERMLRSQN